MIKPIVRCIILAGLGFTTAANAVDLPEQILACRTVADAIERAECYDRAVDALKPPVEIPDTLATTPPEPAEPPEPPSSPTPSIAPTLSVAAEPEPIDPEAEVVELKQQVADLEQQVAILAQETEAATEGTTEPGSASVSPEELFGKEETESRDTLRKLFGLREVDQIEATLADVKRTPYGKLVMVLDNGQIWTQIDGSRLRVKPGDGVRIKAARLGSFLLEKQTGSLLIRVKRVD